MKGEAPFRNSASELWVPRSPTPWNTELQNELLQFFQSCDYPFRSILEIPFKEPLRSEIRRFFISLDAYIESPNPVIPYRDLLYGAADIEFSSKLKKIKRKSFLTTWNAQLFEIPDWWNDVPAYRINDIGDIFNYSYLIFFEEEVDDYKWGNVPVEINQGTLSLFKRILTEILPERNSFEKLETLDTLSAISSSIAIERNSFKHKPHYKIKNKYLTLSRRRNPCERSRIRVSPENCRDSVLNDPGDLNTISLIDQQLLEVLRVIPQHIHLRDKEKCTKRYNSLYNNFHYFLHRDLKKEGITKPRELLKAMLEVLHSVYPDIEIFGFTDFYDTFALRVDGELIYPKRGHGLGMANALTTLMQITIHHMVLDELWSDTPFLHSKSLSLNDDFTAGFKTEEDLELYWDKEAEIMDDLSLIREPTKSFYTYNHFVLAERYYTPRGEYKKVSYQLRELLLPLACVNITHAKDYFCAAQTYTSSEYTPRYLGELRSYWGYEFYPMEFEYPSIVGGWINEKVNSVDLSLLLLDQLDLKSYVFRGYNASREKLWKRQTGEIFSPPIERLTGYPYIPDEYKGNFDILPMSAVDDRYGKILSRSRKNFISYWERLRRLRQKEFKRPFDSTYEELIRRIVEDHPTTQFYPCELMINQYHRCDILRMKIDDIYLDPNPKLALLSLYNETAYNFKEDFSIAFTAEDASTKKTSSLFSKEIQRSLKSELISSLMTGRSAELYYPKDDYHPEEQYLNPVKIGEVTAILNWGKGYPELRKEFVSPIIEKKRRVFNRIFSLKEQELLTRAKLSRPVIKVIAGYLNNNPNTTLKELLEEVSHLFREYEEKRLLDSLNESLNPFHLGTDKNEKTVESELLGVITIDDLLGDNTHKFYTWYGDRESYKPADKNVERVLGRLGVLYMYLTHHMLRTPQQKDEIAKEISGSSPEQEDLFFAKLVGLHRVRQTSFFEEESDGDNPFDSLFEEL